MSAASILDELSENETIVWRGAPLQPPTSVISTIAQSVLIIALAIAIFFGALSLQSSFEKMALPALASLALVCVAIKSLLIQKSGQTIEYAITNKRVIITYNTLFNKVKAFALSSIDRISAGKDKNEQDEIIFGTFYEAPQRNNFQILTKTSELGKKNSLAPKFSGLSNIDEVLGILNSLKVNSEVDNSSLAIRQLSNAVSEDVRRRLDADERIVWQGVSTGLIYGSYHPTVLLLLSILFFIATFFSTNVLAIILSTCYMLWTIKRYSAKDKSLGRANEYIITNKRVFIINNILLSRTRVFPLQAVDQIFIKKSIFNRATVILGQYRALTGRLAQSSELGARGFKAPLFINIKDTQSLKLALEQHTNAK